MSEITLSLDRKAEKNIEILKEFYGLDSIAELIRKSLTLLKVAAQVQHQNGKLVAYNEDKTKQTEIIVE